MYKVRKPQVVSRPKKHSRQTKNKIKGHYIRSFFSTMDHVDVPRVNYDNKVIEID